MTGPPRVRLYEVGPRDGLQNVRESIPTARKLGFIHRLAEAGPVAVEATSFVSPRWVPQLADAEAVLRGLRRRPGVAYPVLVPNERGYERARSAGADAIALFAAATEGFSRRNTGCTIEESLQRLRPVAGRALGEGLWLRGYVSCCFGCPYEGEVDPARVVRVCERLLEMGVHELSVGDTVGVADPEGVRRLVGALLERVDSARVALHLHDTGGRALENARAGWELGVGTFDASAGGLGGCPYAPGAPGNVSTSELARFFEDRLGVATGVDARRVDEAARWLRGGS